MQIQVNAGRHIQGGQSLEEFFINMARESLERFGSHITRVEINIKDQNADKQGNNDKSCTIEARLAGLKPTAVTNEDSSVEAAVSGALDKLTRSLNKTIGRLENQ